MNIPCMAGPGGEAKTMLGRVALLQRLPGYVL
jgi:hypothetical protein